MLDETPLVIDFETRSLADLPLIGGRLYAEDPSTEAICCCARFADDGPWRGTWIVGDHRPDWAEAPVIAAHNADGFDTFIWRALDWPEPKQWIDTSALARASGLPGSLEEIALRYGEGFRKDLTGNAITLALSDTKLPPSRKDKTTGEPVVAIPDDIKAVLRAYHKELKASPGRWPDIPGDVLDAVVRYCAMDVDVTVDVVWPLVADFADLEPRVLEVWRRVNDRGVLVDTRLARALLASDEKAGAAALARGGVTAADVRGPARFINLIAQQGVIIENAQYDTVEPLTRHENSRVRALAEARLALASIASGKLRAGLARTGRDGRMRDNVRYFGAHTGRGAGSGMQLQNFPHPDGVAVDGSKVKKWNDARVCAEAENPRDFNQAEISMLLRACIMAPPGRILVAADFSGIEARANAWAAGDDAAVATFAAGGDAYAKLACRLFGIDPAKFSKEDHFFERDTSKKAELGCFAADTRVLTKRGPQAITSVCADDWLWDGVEWVQSAGVVYQGRRETIDLAGVQVTPDHKILCGGTWTTASQVARDAGILSRALATARGLSSSSPTRLAPGAVCSRSLCDATADGSGRSTRGTIAPADRHAVISARNAKPGRPRRHTWVMLKSSLTARIARVCSTGFRLASSVAKTLDRVTTRIMAGAGFESRSTGARSCSTSSHCPDGMIRDSSSTASTTIGVTNPGICDSLRNPRTLITGAPSPPCSDKSTNLRPVYDIANAGPRNRFVILTDAGPLIVHNCGYQMGAPKFTLTAEKGGMRWRDPCECIGDECDAATCGVREVDDRGNQFTHGARTIVKAWRELHKPIVDFWYALERAAVEAVDGRTSIQVDCAQAFSFDFVGRDLALILPSGRPVVYRRAHVVDGKYGPQVKFQGARGWAHLYGGLLCENGIQAFCRELLVNGMVNADDAGLEVILTVHDEIVAEAEERRAQWGYDTLCAAMKSQPAYADGMPIAVEGFIAKRYRK